MLVAPCFNATNASARSSARFLCVYDGSIVWCRRSSLSVMCSPSGGWRRTLARLLLHHLYLLPRKVRLVARSTGRCGSRRGTRGAAGNRHSGCSGGGTRWLATSSSAASSSASTIVRVLWRTRLARSLRTARWLCVGSAWCAGGGGSRGGYSLCTRLGRALGRRRLHGRWRQQHVPAIVGR